MEQLEGVMAEGIPAASRDVLGQQVIFLRAPHKDPLFNASTSGILCGISTQAFFLLSSKSGQ